MTIDRAGVVQLQVDGNLVPNIPPIQYFTGSEPDLPADQVIAGYLNDGQRAFLYELSVGDFERVTGGTSSQARRVLFSREDSVENRNSAYPSDVTQDMMELQVHLGKRLLHLLRVLRRHLQ